MRLYNLEEVLFDDRQFFPANLEPRNDFGMPIVPDDSPVLLSVEQMGMVPASAMLRLMELEAF